MTISLSLLQAMLILSTVFAGAVALFVGGRGRLFRDLKGLSVRDRDDDAARRQGLVLILSLIHI